LKWSQKKKSNGFHGRIVPILEGQNPGFVQVREGISTTKKRES